MVKHGSEWYRQKAIENQKRKREQEKARRNYQINRQRRDLEELEALKNQLLRDARAERRKNSRNG